MTKRTFWDRLQEAMADNGMETENLTAAASLIKKHYTAATKWRDGGYPSMSNAVRLAEKLGVSVEWLLTGRGSKRPSANIPPDLGELADFWGRLPLDVRAEIIGFAKYKRSTTFTGDRDRREEYQERIARKPAHQPKKS